MINIQQYAGSILRPSLSAVGMCSIDAMYLMMRTAMMESDFTHLKQNPVGPALGLFQIEPATFHDVCRYLGGRADIKQDILDYCNYRDFPSKTNHLIHDLAFNALIARVKYWMQPEPLPSFTDVKGQADYYKRYYNSYNGKGTVSKFIEKCREADKWNI